MTSGIYIITNIKNSKVYVGSSRNIEKRFYTHRYRLNNDCHHSSRLQKAWNEHGESSFDFRLLEEVEEANLIQVEQKFIDQYKAWQDYNIQKIAAIGGATRQASFTNPHHCDRPMRCNGKTKVGSQQYRCKCGFTLVDSPNPHGSEPIGDRPMTGAERSRLFRAKKRANGVPKKRGRPKKDKGEI